MKIWLLREEVDYEGGTVRSLHSTLAKALVALNKKALDFTNPVWDELDESSSDAYEGYGFSYPYAGFCIHSLEVDKVEEVPPAGEGQPDSEDSSPEVA